MTSFRIRLFTDVIKYPKTRSSWIIPVGFKSNTNVLTKHKGGTHRRKGDYGKMESEIGLM